MNDATLIQLKVLVERVVRPIQASIRRKRRMREELLAHVVATFQEEAAESMDDHAALQRTAERLGNPTELSEQIRASLPPWDRFSRIVDTLWTRPGESPLPRALRRAALLESLTAPALVLGVSLSAFINGKPISFTGLRFVAPDFVVFFFVAFGFVLTTEWLSKDTRWAGPRLFWRNLARIAVPFGALACGLCPAFYWAFGGSLADFYVSAFIPLWTVAALAITAHVSAVRRQHEQEWEGLPV
jgi:hypothetical protein